MAKTERVTKSLRLPYPEMRREIESQYPELSQKAKRHLTNLRVKRKLNERDTR